MSSFQQNEIIIHGTTSSGKVFRPSDWAERLCGILSSFNKDNRLAYHEWVHPILLNKVRCVAIDAQLQEINPAMFRFLMDFAADNDLRIMTAEEVASQERQPEKNQTNHQNIESQQVKINQIEENQSLLQTEFEPTAENYVLREINPNEIASAFAALSVLRPALTDINRFVEQVNMMQRKQGYRLLGIFEDGKSSAVAVCGFREKTDLSSGHQLHVDDIVTIPQCRRRGYATLLLNEVRKIAMQMGISQVHADCLVGTERTTAHRMYFQNGFEILSHHFICKI
ncbi:GNAT family N-acetyltransferase [Wielerella bovis]|uniref:GNAT family N-acetyltransferase n=1 Tax=Wielerella bovis TaxID=2917790 RepID=UPI00201892DF|nr:GNAT family N-acetyltransferase [Wielerella bovis]ULJ62683.1 GNAT family N-acetyltransferase [Wielerella bovis]